MSQTQNTTLDVEGMSCNSCVKHVNSALRGLDGVQDVQVDLKGGRVSVAHDPKLPTQQLIAALEEAGYPACEKPGHG
ncbi:MAG TPA: heavy metal-associated domain-containing protein [Polyangiaceae bacterium]|nr:heavy metal-associated domain-containing protein [Polyangiaceae bacterium]